jgi:hypothetical protein
MRPRQLVLLAGLLLFGFCTYTVFRLNSRPVRPPTKDDTRPPSYVPPVTFDEPPPAKKPKAAPVGSHPIRHLITDAEREFKETKARQSKTLGEAVNEYRRRYGIPPPPNFDKWFAFAKENDVQLVDEFDMIHELLTPFWGLKPATIRDRAKEALGFGNALLGVQIRGQKVTHIDGGSDWQMEATQGMMKKFLKYLPDMDLAFNIHDEPRVIVPHEDMARLVEHAKTVNMPSANAARGLRNSFTQHAKDLNDGASFDETKLTRFNFFAHQPTWTHSRMSCPPDSPARALEEDERQDDTAKYGLGELGFIYNVTAMSDICYSPSLASTHGFFDRPNAYNIVHDLFPIFSQSKMSSYADILYPSPWYWYEKVAYDERKDYAWADKHEQLYWRGSTTGGFSRNGGWRRQHRQRFVRKINAADQARILVNRGGEVDGEQRWQAQEVPRGDYRALVDVYFSHVGQCDPGDCDAQREFFEIKSHADQQKAWKYKHLLDMDGNAFSGRFYAFLKSRSLVYKLAVFREWHLEWLRPWAHYIPLSLQGEDWLESVRFFGDGASGGEEAERLAMQGREWSGKVLRNVDLEAWFFRLLLE